MSKNWLNGAWLWFVILVPCIYATDPCGPGTCFIGAGGCTPSVPGTPCVECQGRGYLNGSSCVYEQYIPASLVTTPIRTQCEDPRQCSQNGVCVPSRIGILCDECRAAGYMDTPTSCVCYELKDDPRAACDTLFPLATEPVLLVNTLDSVTCDAHTDPIMGFYRATPAYLYGTPDPPVPNQCWSTIYGPDPTALYGNRPPFQACNTYCDVNPNEFYGPSGDSSCVPCSGQGFWNSTSYTCACYPHWQHTYLGQNFYNESAYTCGECEGYWGPPVGDPAGPDFCTVPWLPNTDGVLQQCSGRGVFIDGQCSCYANATAGHWSLVTIMGIPTCLACSLGYGPPGDCRLPNGETFTPTSQPTTYSPSQSPSVAMNQCPVCYGASLGQALIQNVERIPVTDPLNTTCCTYSNMTAVTDTLLYVTGPNGTCLQSFWGRQSLGWTLCSALHNCTGFSWYPQDVGFAYYFTSSEPLSYIESPESGSSKACVQ